MTEPPIRPTTPGPLGSPGVPVHRPRREVPTKPRRVRAGVKFTALQDRIDHGSASGPWMSFVAGLASVENQRAGREYAELGQVRSMEIEPGAVHAFVQGRLDSPYRTSLVFRRVPDEVWSGVVDVMADQAAHAARVLSGELPGDIDELFRARGAGLFARDASDVDARCSCREGGPWCKHACCLALLVAQRLAAEPLLAFVLRGVSAEDLIDRVRQRRAVAGSTEAVPVHTIRVPGVSDAQAQPLEQFLEHFWECGPELRELDLPIGRPQVSHPILRRLGPSPFTESRFPLVGLLATCYDVMSESVIRAAGPAALEAAPEAPAEEEGDDES
ncbi:MAG: hypothetical protein IT439_10590 [Phycisphaerales bacterium]|nr:hypothetical protein [Phycisphaerales bacterium]